MPNKGTYQDISPVFNSNKLSGYELEYDEDAIKNSLLNLFTIQKGDVPGKPYLGNPLDLALFDLFDFFTQKDIETAIINTIGNYEPRVQLHNVFVDAAPEYNRIIITINYSFVVGGTINYDSLKIPYSHNTISYLGGRIRPSIPKQTSNCLTK
jgi:phage baseplate assembly protein W